MKASFWHTKNVSEPSKQVVAAKEDSRTDAETLKGGHQPLEKELGGPTGPEPTRFGDWERNGRCIDF